MGEKEEIRTKLRRSILHFVKNFYMRVGKIIESFVWGLFYRGCYLSGAQT